MRSRRWTICVLMFIAGLAAASEGWPLGPCVAVAIPCMALALWLSHVECSQEEEGPR